MFFVTAKVYLLIIRIRLPVLISVFAAAHVRLAFSPRTQKVREQTVLKLGLDTKRNRK